MEPSQSQEDEPFLEGLAEDGAGAHVPDEPDNQGEGADQNFLNAVIAEHRAMLRAAGYSDHRRQGSVHKYSAYLKRIILAAGFESRSALFEHDAWSRAARACIELSEAGRATNTASSDKLYKNYMRGYSTFVKLALA